MQSFSSVQSPLKQESPNRERERERERASIIKSLENCPFVRSGNWACLVLFYLPWDFSFRVCRFGWTDWGWREGRKERALYIHALSLSPSLPEYVTRWELSRWMERAMDGGIHDAWTCCFVTLHYRPLFHCIYTKQYMYCAAFPALKKLYKNFLRRNTTDVLKWSFQLWIKTKEIKSGVKIKPSQKETSEPPWFNCLGAAPSFAYSFPRINEWKGKQRKDRQFWSVR